MAIDQLNKWTYMMKMSVSKGATGSCGNVLSLSLQKAAKSILLPRREKRVSARVRGSYRKFLLSILKVSWREP